MNYLTAGVVCLAIALATIPFAPELGRTLVPSPSHAVLSGSPLSVPAFLTPELVALLVVFPVLSFGNGTLSVALTTLVSKEMSNETQGSAFGVTQGAGSLGRTVGPPTMASIYVLARWSPFVAGVTLLVPVLLILARRR